LIDSDNNNFAAMLSSTMQTYLTPMTAGMVDVWWNVLKGYDFSTVRRAMSDHIKDPESGRWAPKPADIIGRLRTRPESETLHLENKKKVKPDARVLERIKQLSLGKRAGPFWTPERVTNQHQVNFIKVQADRFGETSMQGRFLAECQRRGIITADFQLGTLNVREPGEDEIETEEAA
jgi:hypothetical protein